MARICIYGAGAIGCYLGGRLAAGSADVDFIGRPGVGEELGQHGLALTHYDGRDWRVPPETIAFSTEPGAAAAADLILVTVKSGATAQAAGELATLAAPNAVVISFQNGIGNADTLRAALPGRSVLAGMVPFNVIRRGPGAFHQASEGEPEVEDAAALAPFLADFTRAGFALRRHRDMPPVQWAKLLLNLNNAVNALSALPLQQELAQRAYRRCLALAQAEALALLKQAGIQPARLTPLPAAWIPALLRLPDALFARLARKMLAIDPSARSSMADDLAAGRRTEVDWINGEVVRLADRLGRRAPVNARLISLIKAAESDSARWSGEALLVELQANAKRN
ncbi:2-dehydropantoate 2-reductase [Bosea sp. 62]|uniref:2-dehydropantoate 2-reductase n=1 Tax=unclassified Bosea (in: a-proteobacteria) TaxID=2653178 RepID=UPI001255CBA6|nr:MULTISPECIES: 2-dehydropantoate 2-reductase [unclassified Bosea (in: a-proteobacteria)]CAD5246355.1 2-dehydropantoate 2-reductase [Bosea sp. 46]CAD5248285.1 2-dehydropantoate 2-reductase [Bosea sp. 21B]CAD5267695.1 2-dehydropantoate 2-reductase [Bosea sp. 7B]VVT45515.1 2-dehydropantoate 2-reductase [Bosea sp. EC-HK365B]VXA94180.1 2-dehydropantoate 2-reductase [Bosea sp. 29B]